MERTNLFLVALLLSAISCSRGVESERPHPVTEAYYRADRGEDALGIFLLEDYLKNNRNDSEARLLLASNYMGAAGINVFSLYDEFKDILFTGDLGKVVKNAEKFLDITAKSPRTLGEDGEMTPAEVVIDYIDHFLGIIRKVVSVLNRLPAIPKEQWPLVDRSLYHLDLIERDKDVALYRLFVRIIYVRDFIVERMIANPEVGTIGWVCRMEVDSFVDDLRWISDHLRKASFDMNFTFPEDSHALIEFQRVIASGVRAFDHFTANAPAGSATGYVILQDNMRKALNCKKRAGKPKNDYF